MNVGIQQMKKVQIQLTPSIAALVAANVVPALGVVYLGWELFPLVFVYWLENGVIGLFTVLKMLTTCTSLSPSVSNASSWWYESGRYRFNRSILILVLFFLVHYGGFLVGHGVFVMHMFGSKGSSLMQTYHIIVANGLQYTILALVLSHGFSFVHNYIGKGEYRNVSTPDMMFVPYRRVVVLHMFILLGGFVMMAAGVSRTGLLLLVIVKVVADVFGHAYERQDMIQTEAAQGTGRN